MKLSKFKHPLAIAMWDFSWLERRWPGAGYEDWDEALSGLKERGYDAVRIDPYPHFVADNPTLERELPPLWSEHDWGAPSLTRLSIEPSLTEFLKKCRQYEIWVGLSTWFREDSDKIRMRINSPHDHAEVWRKTLEKIDEAGLIDQLLYVDLCNEWPLRIWAPFFQSDDDTAWYTENSAAWMEKAISELRGAYPNIPYCFSFTGDYSKWQDGRVNYMDLLEPHLWMVSVSDFYQRIGFCDSKDYYETMAEKAKPLYLENPDHWKSCLKVGIERLVSWSRDTKLPLITTEGWGVVNYKDGPLLDWEWVKELCEYGVEAASESGRWIAMATSNFCGPQFVGMWRDVAWHRRLTSLIKHGAPPKYDSR